MTAKRPVVDEYHGVKVTDDYQWLEKSDDPEVVKWIEEQKKRTRGYLDALPERPAIKARIQGIMGALSSDHVAIAPRKDKLFAMRIDPKKQQHYLVVLKSASDPGSERTLVDPNVIDPSGKTSIDFYNPSWDGKKVAVSLSKGGSESGDVHIYDVETGKETGDVIPRVNGGTAGGSLAWADGDKHVYYTRYPAPGERAKEDLHFYQQVYVHKLGDPVEKDTYAIGKDFPKIAETDLYTSPDGKYVIASVKNGDGGDMWHYLLGPKGGWVKVADLADRVKHAKFGPDKKLYLMSFKGAPKGKILRVPLDKPSLDKAEVVVPEGDVTIQSLAVTDKRLYVVVLAGGPSEVRAYDLKGKSLGALPTPKLSAVRQLVKLGGDDILFRNTSYVEPAAWYRWDAKAGKSERSGLFMTSPVSFGDAEAVREMCTSKDGTKVPLNIIRPKGHKLDGSGVALLIGYGGYGISLVPGFDPIRRVWLDNGGAVAIANLRGGGEFGEEWHLGGNLEKKQNVFDDFAACAKHLIDSGHTKPERLAVLGGSNGGLLMGAMLTQHPEMVRAVASFVGIYDMLRVELTPNGVFNVPEFGTVKDPNLFKAMFAYSPYHNVKDGVAYPATMFFTGANDPRVDPYHSRKMTARMQAASGGKVPVYLLPSNDRGHGGGTPLDAQIEEEADLYAFLFDKLGVKFKAK